MEIRNSFALALMRGEVHERTGRKYSVRMCVQQMYYLVVCILARDGGIRGEQPHEKKLLYITAVSLCKPTTAKTDM